MHIYIHTYIYLYTHVYICIYIYMYRYIYKYVYIHIYIYTYMYIYTHVYTYSHKYMYAHGTSSVECLILINALLRQPLMYLNCNVKHIYKYTHIQCDKACCRIFLCRRTTQILTKTKESRFSAPAGRLKLPKKCR